MPLPEFVSTFLLRVISSAVAKAVVAAIKAPVNILPAGTLRRHRSDLEKTIHSMPFIYHGLEGEVLSDYVDVETLSLDPGTLELKQIAKVGPAGEERLKNNARILFLGNAGVGKTTFQRYSILLLLRGKKNPPFVYGEERLIPIYVPLKAIDNSSPKPILSYITNNMPPFAGPRGMQKLAKLAKRKRLFLFLDGYDEIPFTGSGKNFVQEELGNLFLGIYRTPEKDSDEYLTALLAGCRIWLSSRREFFGQNPIGGLGLGRPHLSQGVIAVELLGIGSNRVKLTKIIFDKYRRQSPQYAELLSEEYFLFHIDCSYDEEIKKLSYNPLFLTIMCYVYAQRAIENNTHKVDWSDQFDDLILECIKLLLRDLDDYKARDLPAAHRAGLLSRRNSFLEEKHRFLEYLSAQLFFQSKPVFDLEYLKSCVREYFSTEEKANDLAESILRDLDNDSSPRPNFPLQLIFCGVFVTAGKSMGSYLYDFPHRRFREVLASKHIATPERYLQLLQRLEEKQFSEFLEVFLASKWFKNRSFQERSAQHIFRLILSEPTSREWIKITSHLLTLAPQDCLLDREVSLFLREALTQSQPAFAVSKAILYSLQPEDEFILEIRSALERGLREDNSPRLSLACELMLHYNPLLLREVISRALETEPTTPNSLPIIIKYALMSAPEMLLEKLNDIAADSRSLQALAFMASKLNYAATEPTSLLPAILKKLDDESSRIFFFTLSKYRYNSYGYLQKLARFDIDSDIFVCLLSIDPGRLLEHLKEAEANDKSECFVFSDHVTGRLSNLVKQLNFSRFIEKELDGGGVGYADIRDLPRDAILKQTSQLTRSIVLEADIIKSSLWRVVSEAVNAAEFRANPRSAIREEIEPFQQLRNKIEELSDVFIKTARTDIHLVAKAAQAAKASQYSPSELRDFFVAATADSRKRK